MGNYVNDCQPITDKRLSTPVNEKPTRSLALKKIDKKQVEKYGLKKGMITPFSNMFIE